MMSKQIDNNVILSWFTEGISRRWKRFRTLVLRPKLIDLLIFLRLSHQYSILELYGFRFFLCRRQVRRSQWYSEKKMRKYQNEHLRKIILHAYKNVPYYRRTFDACGIRAFDISDIDQLSRIPILEKDTVRSDVNDLKAKNIRLFKHVKYSTSGSTGKPLSVCIDKKLATLGANLYWRHFNWGGYVFNKRLVMFGRPLGFFEHEINKKDLWSYTRATNTLQINTALLGDKHMKAICEKIAEFDPEYIYFYPSLAYALASYLVRHNAVKIRPKSAFSWSEKLYAEQKQFIEQVFGCRIYEFYGMLEYLMFAYACPHGSLHTTPELGIIEIVKNGKICKKGEVGELVCTTLHNHSMPLIRYAMGDYGYIKDVDCPCGRKSEVLFIVGCRDKDLIVTKNGFVNVMSRTPWFNQKSRIKQIQFFQEKKGEVVVKLVPDEGFNDVDMNNLKESLSNYFGDSVDLSYELVDKIPRTKAGKYKYVDSKVPIEF